MDTIIKITIRAFVFFMFTSGIFLGAFLSIYSTNALKGLALGLLAGFLSAIPMSLYFFVGLVLFKRKAFFYRNIPAQLQAHDVKNVYLEGVAGNATRGRIRYGGLFLADDAILFIPHRFAIRPKPVILPLEKIKEVREVGINLLKSFSGGLRGRLLLETKDGEHYEFSVWEIDKWIKDINERLTPSSPSSQRK